MQHPLRFGAGIAVAALGWFVLPGPSTPIAPVPAPATADGHYVLVVDGDRDHLTITRAVAKGDPWAGAAKGLTSDWTLTIRGAAGEVLAELPVDLSQFAVDAGEAGKPVRVEGCVVRDPHVAMLVNAPRFVAAASYVFTRRDGAVVTTVGEQAGAAIAALAGERR
ncbi:MAG: hypothetical protein JNN13_14140 [Planctomycetes bacterium]|nr:hypothetical protein [Planctomycetota bacterium]